MKLLRALGISLFFLPLLASADTGASVYDNVIGSGFEGGHSYFLSREAGAPEGADNNFTFRATFTRYLFGDLGAAVQGAAGIQSSSNQNYRLSVGPEYRILPEGPVTIFLQALVGVDYLQQPAVTDGELTKTAAILTGTLGVRVPLFDHVSWAPEVSILDKFDVFTQYELKALSVAIQF